MNLWRWLGASLFLLGAFCLVSAARLPVYAGGKDKDKTEKEKDKGKDKDAKDKDAKDKDAKGAKDKDAKDKDAKDKDKDKDKGEKKVTPPVVGGETLPFLAFDPKGKPFFQEQATETKQTMTVMGQKVEQKQDQTFLIQWTPGDLKGKNYVVKQKIVGVKMNIDIGGNKISFDSTAKNPKNPMTDFFEALMKEELTFNVTPELTVESVEGRDKFVKNLIDINPQMQGLLKAILSDAALKKMAEPTWWAYPKDGKVSKDLTWNKDATLELGPIGNYKTDFAFTYVGQEKGMDKIGIKTKLTYSAPQDKTGLPFVIQKAELKGDNGTGEALFDRVKGRFQSTKMEMDLNGKITIDVGNMTTEVTLDQKQKASSTTFDAMPDNWKPKQ